MKHGLSLLECVATLAIFSILIVGLQSSVIVSLKGIPGSASPIAVYSRAQRAIDDLVGELETARYISELTPTSLAFTVSDRNGDGMDEQLRYAWSGTSGAPLVRQLNGGPSVTVIPSLVSFGLISQTRNESSTYPALCVEDANESLLIDQSTVTQALEHDISNSQSLAQRFTFDLPAGAYAWRPTRIQFLAKYASVLGTSTVQFRPNSAGCVPGGDIWQQHFLSWLTLGSNYSWQSFDLTSVDRLPSGSGFTLVLQRYFASRAATVPSSSSASGLLKGNAAANSWELQDSRGLVCQVFGKLWRTSNTRTLTTTRTTAIEVTARPDIQRFAIRSTVNLLNEPPALTNLWQLDFQTNPTSVDSNGNGQADWALLRPGSISASSLTSSGWQTSGDQLTSTQDWNFNTPTIIELTAQAEMPTGEGAVISANVLRNGSNCVPLTVRIKKQSDGTQSVTVQARVSDSQTTNLVSLTQPNNLPVNLRLIIDPTSSAVSVFVSEVPYGTFGVTPYASSQNSRRIILGANGSPALFRNLRISAY